MTIEFEDLEEKLRSISLTGRLDIQGTEEISTEFNKLNSEAKQNVIIDLSAVSFLASMGIRQLISNAKALQHRGGRMILYVGDNALISKILETTNISELLPLFRDIEDAKKAALA
jgi:anti-sigma B factor antagonist